MIHPQALQVTLAAAGTLYAPAFDAALDVGTPTLRQQAAACAAALPPSCATVATRSLELLDGAADAIRAGVRICVSADLASEEPPCDTSGARAAELDSQVAALLTNMAQLNFSIGQAAWPVRQLTSALSDEHIVRSVQLMFVPRRRLAGTQLVTWPMRLVACVTCVEFVYMTTTLHTCA